MGRSAPLAVTVAMTGLLLVPSAAPVAASSPAYSAAASGSAVDVRLLGGTAGVAAGVSAASVDSRPSPAPPDRVSALGAGLQASLAGLTLPPPVQTHAPGSPASDRRELGPLDILGLAAGRALSGAANSAWAPETCVLGRPLGDGQGEAAGVELLRPGPRPLVSAALVWSRSTTSLEPQGGGYAVVSEARVRMAPVTLLTGSPDQITVELLGEWRLRTVATGRPGGPAPEFGPVGEPGPTTPVVRITFHRLDLRLALQDLLGPSGLTLPPELPVELSIGAKPRSDGSTVSADVVRVRIPSVTSGLPHIAEVRLGHLEVRAAVPSGGVDCRLPVRKTVDRDPRAPGDEFRWTISVPSSATTLAGTGCDLGDIRVTDTALPSAGVRFRLVAASAGGRVDGATVRWDSLPRYHPGDPPITLTIDGLVDLGSERGSIANTVVVSATLDRCTTGMSGGPPAHLLGTFHLGK